LQHRNFSVIITRHVILDVKMRNVVVENAKMRNVVAVAENAKMRKNVVAEKLLHIEIM
jgi:hypothetical protein